MDRYRVITDHQRQHDQAMAFCEANGLEAKRIPAEDGLRIIDDVIHFRRWDKNGVGIGPWETTPLLSPPHAHGLASHEVVATDVIAARIEAALIKEAGYHSADDPGMGVAMRGLFKRQAAMLAEVVQEIVATEVSR